MKTTSLLILLTIASLFVSKKMNAQTYKISAYGQQALALGDITKKDITSNSAGYVDMVSMSGLELNYYPKNKFGIGLRWVGNYYGRDAETYEADLIEMLGILDEQYDVTQTYAFWSFGSSLGISYLVDIAEKWQVEPYFYVGFKILTSPQSSVVYNQNNTTYQYNSKSQLYVGTNYSPGLKIHWKALKKLGLFLSMEYDGNSYLEEQERSMLYSYNSLELFDNEKKYTFNSFNLGLGLAFNFGKGLK